MCCCIVGFGGCMQFVYCGFLGGNVGRNKFVRGNCFEVSFGQKKCNGDYWNVKYIKNLDDYNVNVKVGGQKFNGDY